jgi:transposase-like protein
MENKKHCGKKRTQKDYSVPFKLQVIEEIERGDLNKDQAMFKYGIQGHTTVLKWLRKYGNLDWTKSNSYFMSLSKKQSPEQRIKELEAALETERQKNLLLNTIIDVAEKQYGLAIRKKPSPRQRSNSSKQGS